MANFAAFSRVDTEGIATAPAEEAEALGTIAEAGVFGVAVDMSAVVLEKGQ
jgi:hypothetical protein